MRFKRPSRRTLVVAAVVVVAVVAGVTWLVRRPDAATAQAVTTTVSLQSFKESVSATGTIEPAAQADLSFTVSGTVTAVNVALGDTVAKGQILATVDDTLLKSQLTAKQSALTAAKTKLSEDSGSSSAQLAADKASVAQAESAVAEAKESLANASLTASIDGTVATLDLEVGDVVGGSGSQAGGSSGTTAQITLVSPKSFIVDAQVATSDIANVQPGLQAEITPTGATEAVYGTVSTVGKVASAQSSGAATFPVTIAVTGDQDALYAGTSATVSIIYKQVDNILAVPAQAIHQDGSDAYVYKLVNGKRVKTAVTLGATYGRETEVTKGLDDGDEVEVISFQLPSGTGTGQQRRSGQTGGFGGSFGGGDPGGQPPAGFSGVGQ